MSGWTEARVEEAKRRWLTGESATEIAKALNCGFTRNAIIGKIHRLGLAKVRSARPSAPSRVKAEPVYTVFDWTEECDIELHRLSKAGMLRIQAASALGCTVDCLNRRVRKLNIEWVRPQPKKRFPVKPTANPSFKPSRGAFADHQRDACTREGQRFVAAFAAPANDHSILLTDRKWGQCAWPLGEPERPGEQLVCGARSMSGSSYCAGHRRIGTTGQVVSGQDLIRSLRRFAA